MVSSRGGSLSDATGMLLDTASFILKTVGESLGLPSTFDVHPKASVTSLQAMLLNCLEGPVAPGTFNGNEVQC